MAQSVEGETGTADGQDTNSVGADKVNEIAPYTSSTYNYQAFSFDQEPAELEHWRRAGVQLGDAQSVWERQGPGCGGNRGRRRTTGAPPAGHDHR